MTEQAAPVFAPPDALVRLVRDGVLDAELAALLSVAVEGGVPLLVAGGSASGRREVRDALLALVPSTVRVVRLAGPDEDFAWMPQAGELGWQATGRSIRATAGRPGALMVADLEPDGTPPTWGEAAHLAIRAMTAGYTLLATVDGRVLQEVLGRLSTPPVGALDDEIARLGVVVVLGEGPRVETAHYLRPVARDQGGHVQRLPPAVLAHRNTGTGRLDHFAWGVLGELAGRAGRQPLDVEREQARRTSAIVAAVLAAT